VRVAVWLLDGGVHNEPDRVAIVSPDRVRAESVQFIAAHDDP